jgi:hypothetical protein
MRRPKLRAPLIAVEIKLGGFGLMSPSGRSAPLSRGRLAVAEDTDGESSSFCPRARFLPCGAFLRPDMVEWCIRRLLNKQQKGNEMRGLMWKVVVGCE